MTCGSGARLVKLGRPIAGRRIEGQSWPSPLRFGSLRHELVIMPSGLPRLLGLAPGQAQRTLRYEGFHARLRGQGREIVSQLPGWGLTGRNGQPHPYSGVTDLVAGRTIVYPTKPVLRAGQRSGTVVGAIRFEGGPFVRHRPAIAGTVVVFDARGGLVARFRVGGAHDFRLRLAPGRYYLLDDIEGPCGDTPALVRIAQQVQVTLGVGCDVP
jgi:hypothetical protein